MTLNATEFKYDGLAYGIALRYDETAPWYFLVYDDRQRGTEVP